MEDTLRKLARSIYWQNLYINAKEIGSFSLFDNNTSLSKIQVLFLHWLSVYNSVYQDLSNEDDYISEEVIKDDIRTDAYLLWRKKSKGKKTKKDTEENPLGLPKIKFKTKRKKN